MLRAQRRARSHSTCTVGESVIRAEQPTNLASRSFKRRRAAFQPAPCEGPWATRAPRIHLRQYAKHPQKGYSVQTLPRQLMVRELGFAWTHPNHFAAVELRLQMQS